MTEEKVRYTVEDGIAWARGDEWSVCCYELNKPIPPTWRHAGIWICGEKDGAYCSGAALAHNSIPGVREIYEAFPCNGGTHEVAIFNLFASRAREQEEQNTNRVGYSFDGSPVRYVDCGSGEVLKLPDVNLTEKGVVFVDGNPPSLQVIDLPPARPGMSFTIILDGPVLPKERTTAISLKLPDGRIVSCPPPEGDGWEVVEEYDWSDKLAIYGINDPEDEDGDVIADCIAIDTNKEIISLPMRHPPAQALQKEINLIDCGECDGWIIAIKATVYERVKTFHINPIESYLPADRLMRPEPPKPYDDSSWPDGGHPMKNF